MNKEKRSLEQVALEEEISRYLQEIAEKAERIKRVVPDGERMLQTSYLKEADQNITEQEGIEPYPLSIFGTSEIIGDNSKAGAYFKLTIQRELLLPELAERFSQGTASNSEFDIWMLNGLEESKRKRILRTIAEWERKTGLKVRFEGVIGE
jgi:hypothetical protein